VPKRQYTEEFRTETVKLAEAVGQHEASRRQRSKGAVIPAQSGASAPVPSRRPVSDLEAENSRLRKELASAKLDIEILRKATAYFAKGSR